MAPAASGVKTSENLNYFVCTLGQAAKINAKSPHDFQTINDFVDLQAECVPDLPAVAFPIPCKGDEKWSSKIFTFKDLRQISVAAAEHLEDTVLSRPHDDTPKYVALLCPSSVDFLFAWLALMRMGYGVLLIAPQCQPAAISHLCNSCEVSLLLHDNSYSSLASESVLVSEKNEILLSTAQLPWQDHAEGISSILHNPSVTKAHESFRRLSEEDVAYIHHTSGTSTGLPKPIPQTHRAGVGVLPCLNGSKTATFTTTPLYHGGIADCFRAWTSSGLIWLFPGTDVPITSETILKSLDSASTASSDGAPEVCYFSSVPYVLQMLSEDTKGVEKLRGMNVVGVGGAALPPSIGDELVTRGINLVSRFGSAECGFLLSSHRVYEQDAEWQYLRPALDSPYLRFEPQPASELHELVILKGWPHMAKTNRDDGSFATADLFLPHTSIRDAWKYHSRKDAQLTLVTGKKFDPQPLEAAIAASSRMIGDCLVFGSGRMVPGVLIFRAEGMDVADNEFVDAIWNGILEINAQGQNHTRIEKSMIVMLPRGAELKKSSKGTVLRGEAEKKFAEEIEGAYSGEEQVGDVIVEDKDILPTIRDIIGSVLGEKSLGDDDDFYRCGIDSAKCAQIRGMKILTKTQTLPFNVVYDCGTIRRLAAFAIQLREDGDMPEDDGYQEMLNLAAKFSRPLPLPVTSQKQEPTSRSVKHTVLLTGATGALGAHMLDELKNSSRFPRIFCLVRASSTKNALSRVNDSLLARRKSIVPPLSDKVICLPSEIGEEHLGLSKADFIELIENVTLIIHAAWPVNFSLPLRTFTPQFYGLQTLLSLTTSPLSPHLVFCSSTASVLRSFPPITENVSKAPSDADSLGYSRSKWVAEQICHQFSNQGISICRIGQLTGDTVNGVWNMSEAFPRMLSTVEEIGCLPDLKGEVLSWLPLDVAARSLIEIATAGRGGVYHVVNDHRSTTWQDLLGWLAEIEKFEVVEPSLWVERLEGLEIHPAKGLVDLWKKAYCGDSAWGARVDFDTGKVKQVALTMKDVIPVDEELFEKIWRWLQEELGAKKRGYGIER